MTTTCSRRTSSAPPATPSIGAGPTRSPACRAPCVRSSPWAAQSLPVADRLLGRYAAGSVARPSFDKGFTRAKDRELLSLYISAVIRSQRGKKNAAETGRKSRKEIRGLAPATQRGGEREQFVVGHGQRQVQVVEVGSGQSAAVAQGAFAAGVVDEDAAPRLGGGREEVAPAVPTLLAGAGQAQPGLMHQSRGLPGLPRRFVGHLVHRRHLSLWLRTQEYHSRGSLADLHHRIFLQHERKQLMAIVDGFRSATLALHMG